MKKIITTTIALLSLASTVIAHPGHGAAPHHMHGGELLILEFLVIAGLGMITAYLLHSTWKQSHKLK